MPKRILICDDEIHILRAVSMKLRKTGFEVATCSNGEDGWNHSLEFAPHAVVTDYQMPVVNGLELCQRIRAHETMQNIPVFLLTAKGFELDHEELMSRYLVSQVIVKPFSPRDLVSALHEHLDRIDALPGSTDSPQT
jgi:DNA-binding response OmpR family regulator